MNGLETRLNAEQLLVIADVERLAVDGDDRDGEPVRIGERELGNVVGDLAVADAAVLLVSSLSVARNGATLRLQAAQQIVERRWSGSA